MIEKEEARLIGGVGSPTTDQYDLITDPDEQEVFGLEIERWTPRFEEHPNSAGTGGFTYSDLNDFCVHKDRICAAYIDYDYLGTTEHLYFKYLDSEVSSDQSWSTPVDILASVTINQNIAPTIVSDGYTIAIYMIYSTGTLRRYVSTNDGVSFSLDGSYTFSNTVYHLAATCPNTVYAVCGTTTSNTIQTVALIYDGTATLNVFGTTMRPKFPYIPDSFDAVRVKELNWQFSTTYGMYSQIDYPASGSEYTNLPSTGNKKISIEIYMTVQDNAVAIVDAITGKWTVRFVNTAGFGAIFGYASQNAEAWSGTDEFVCGDGKKHHIYICLDGNASPDTPVADRPYMAIDGKFIESYSTHKTGTGGYSSDAASQVRVSYHLYSMVSWLRVSDTIRWKPEDGNFEPPGEEIPYADDDTVLVSIDDGEGTSVTDRAGNGNHGTMSGSGYSWVAANSGPDLLVWSVDLPPYCGDNEDGSYAYKRQGLIGCHVHWASYDTTDPMYDREPGFSEVFPIDVYDRAGPNQYRSDIRLSKMPNGRIFLTAWGQDGANNVPDSDWLDEPEGIFMYWSMDGRNFTVANMFATSEFIYYGHAMTSDHAGVEILLYNPPYVYAISSDEIWRAKATRLFGDPHDDCVLTAPEDSISQVALNYGAASQSQWVIADPDGDLSESFLSEPGDIIMRLFIGAVDEDNSELPRMLVATQWLDTFDFDDQGGIKTVILTCRGPVGRMITQNIIAHTKDFPGQVHGFSYWSHTTRGMDNLSQVAGISGTWSMDGSNGLKLVTATTTGCYVDQMHSTWLNDFVDGIFIFHFKLDATFTGTQAAMATLRSYGRYCHWKIAYLYDYAGTDSYHDDIYIQRVQGTFGGEVKLQANVGWSRTSDNYLRIKIYRNEVWIWHSTNGLDWTPCSTAASASLLGEATELTGPEEEVANKRPMIGAVGLGGYADSTGRSIRFDFLKVCSSHLPYTLEDAIKEICAFAGVPKVTFDSHLMELPNADGEYNLDGFTTGAGTVTFVDNRMKIEGGSAAWGYVTSDIDTPDSFKLTAVVSGYKGEIRFKTGGTYNQDSMAVGWETASPKVYIAHRNAVGTATVYDGLAGTALGDETEITICVRAVHFALTGAEADYWTISVFLDGSLTLIQEFPIDWVGGNKLYFCAYDTTGDTYISNVRIAELTEFVDYFGVDHGRPVMQSISDLIQNQAIEIIPRFDGSIHFRRIGSKTVASDLSEDHVSSFRTHFSARDLATHYRIEGAYDEVDYIDKTLINYGHGQHFKLLKNETLITVDDIHRHGPSMINLAYEKAHNASIIVRGDPSMEVGDLISFGRLHTWLVATELGGLSYPSGDVRFQDNGIERDGSDVPWYRYHSTSAPAWNIIIITNSDGTICWAYIGGGTATTYYFTAYKDAGMTTTGFNGDTSQPSTDGKTPSSYKIFRAGLWVIEQLKHVIKNGTYYLDLGCRGYDKRRA